MVTPLKKQEESSRLLLPQKPAATAQNYGSVQWNVQKLLIILSPVRLQRNLISNSEEQINRDGQLTNNFLSASVMLSPYIPDMYYQHHKRKN